MDDVFVKKTKFKLKPKEKQNYYLRDHT